MRNASFSITTFEVFGLCEGVKVGIGEDDDVAVCSTCAVSFTLGFFVSLEDAQAEIASEHTIINVETQRILGVLFIKAHRFLLGYRN